MQSRRWARLAAVACAALSALALSATCAGATSRIKDLANIEGVRQNQLIGYGLVVGLNGTGDTLNNIPFTKQSLQAMLERMGVNIRGQTIRTGNVADGDKNGLADIVASLMKEGAGSRDAAALADTLDLPIASELAAGAVTGDGVRQPVPDPARAVLGDEAPRTWWEHDELRVDGVEVEWWVDDEGIHAVTTSGLAAGLAQVVGRWDRRWALEVALSDERRAAEIQLGD